jgi:protein ImuA
MFNDADSDRQAPASAAAGLLQGPLGRALWRGSELAGGPASAWSSGFAALDAVLPGGGWPAQALSEILQPRPGVCEFRLLGPALEPALAGGRPLLLINPPFTPHLPGLAAWGLAPRQLLWLAPATPLQTLWTLEQALKANAAGALMAWLPEARPEQLRRLQACALGAHAPCFVFRPETVTAQSSAAPLRLLLRPEAGWTLTLRLLKRRGPALAAPLRLRAVPPALEPLLSQRLLQGEPLPLATPTPTPLPAPESRDVLAALARPARHAQGLGV